MLSNAIETLYGAQKTYGKTPEQMEKLAQMIVYAFSDKPAQDVREALAKMALYSSELPTVAELAQVIYRKGKPPFDKTVYLGLARKRDNGDGMLLSSDDWAYLRDYENYMKSGW